MLQASYERPCRSAKQTDPHIYTDTVFHSQNTLKNSKKSKTFQISAFMAALMMYKV